MFRNVLISLGLVFSFSLSANTLQVCNGNSDRAIFAALMQQVGNGNGWQSRGWFKVDAATCKPFELGSYVGKVFTYAQDEFNETSWGEGPTQFCVNKTAAFSYPNADSAPCSESFQTRVKSDEVTIQAGTTDWKVEPNFTRINLCNRNSQIPVFAAYAKSNGPAWTSKGWFKIDPDTCKLVSLGKYEGDVQTYAEYNGGELHWGTGPFQFCVNRTQAFSLDDAANSEHCPDSAYKMVHASTHNLVVGTTTTIEFSPQLPKSELKLCNETSNKDLLAAYALVNSSKLQSKGWIFLPKGQCSTVDTGTYTGEAHVYAEFEGGEEYWGTGPTNICVHRTNDFSIDDATNEAACNSSTNYKMVPTYKFEIKTGTNKFGFTR